MTAVRAIKVSPNPEHGEWIVKFFPAKVGIKAVRKWATDNAIACETYILESQVVCHSEEDAMLLFMAFR